MKQKADTGADRHGTETTGKTCCHWRNLLKWSAVGVLLIFLFVLLYIFTRFTPDRTEPMETMEDHFKYGSTGGERVTGIPVKVWQAMPLVCAQTLEKHAGDRLADDYVARTSDYKIPQQDPVAVRQALSREGFKALGFLYETDAAGNENELPIGISKRHFLGLDRVYINCAICHTGTVREHPTDTPQIMLGMPANQFNLYGFEHFVFDCIKNGRGSQLTLPDFIAEIDSLGESPGPVDRYLVYPLAMISLREAMHFVENIAGFSIRQPHWGPGRNDTFTNNKVFLYGYPWRERMPDYHKTGEVDAETLGIVDWPSIWMQRARKKRSDGRPMQLHWDGNNDHVEERNLNASLATSALPPAIDHESIECIEQWLETLEPPPYPFAIDRELAARGEPIYRDYCSECHGRNGRDFSGEKVGFVTPLEHIGTDPFRLQNYSETLALNMAVTYAEQEREIREHTCPGGTRYVPPSAASGHETTDSDRMAAVNREENTYRYKHYRSTNGYANMPLDGIWLRAPYLHNGSVPTMRDLLEAEEHRPDVFFRGNDIYDQGNLGFVWTSESDSDGRKFFRYDVSVPGNSNAGHSGYDYGTGLSAEDKQALIEYMKTF